MREIRNATAVVVVLAASVSASAAQSVEEVVVPVGVGIVAYADVHLGPLGTSGPVVLLFHQGRGNARGEYRDIVPRLLREGYSAIAIDARGGGDLFGAQNRASSQAREGFSFCDALTDVDSVVTLARRRFTGPVVLWGSSYSATLSLHVAARRPRDVSAVLAFSPAGGDPMRGCDPLDVAQTLVGTRVPVMLVRPQSEAEVPQVQARMAALESAGLPTVVFPGNQHGSSVMSTERSGNVDAQWTRVLAFIRDATR